MLLFPVPPDQWGGEHDAKFFARFQKAGKNLPIVQELEKGAEWEDLGDLTGGVSGQYHNEGGKGTARGERNSFFAKTLSGVHTLGGFQRVFRNTETGGVVAVVHIGSAAWGWPFVAHGGLLATILDECLAICGSLDEEQFVKTRKRAVTETLKIRYLQKVGWSPLKENFWVIRAESKRDREDDRKMEKGSWSRCAKGTLETLDGVICVEAEGCYTASKELDESLR